MKADLHMHGPIGFQKYFLKKQGYQGKNLLKEIADTCFSRDLGICAITSEEDEIPRNTLHDRFNWLKNNYANNLPNGYDTDTRGDNILIVTNNNKKLYLINGQTVRTGKKGDPLFKGDTIDYLVIGTNQIPNHESIDDTVKRVYEHPAAFGGAEHGLCEAHGGMGEDKMKELLPYMTFIEGHNSQLIFPVPAFVPGFGNYRRGINTKTQAFADNHKKSWIATSDAHRIPDAGLSSIKFDSQHLDTSSGCGFIRSFENIIDTNQFTNHCNYQNPFTWVSWVSRMIVGVKLGKHKE